MGHYCCRIQNKLLNGTSCSNCSEEIVSLPYDFVTTESGVFIEVKQVETLLLRLTAHCDSAGKYVDVEI